MSLHRPESTKARAAELAAQDLSIRDALEVLKREGHRASLGSLHAWRESEQRRSSSSRASSAKAPRRAVAAPTSLVAPTRPPPAATSAPPLGTPKKADREADALVARTRSLRRAGDELEAWAEQWGAVVPEAVADLRKRLGEAQL